MRKVSLNNNKNEPSKGVRFCFAALVASEEENINNLYNGGKNMANGKVLQEFYGVPPIYTKQQKAEAMENGALTFQNGGTYQNCPECFRPKPGDNVLSHEWVTGFEAAKIAATVRV